MSDADGSSQPEEKPTFASETKVCPFCGETIKAAAMKCSLRHHLTA